MSEELVQIDEITPEIVCFTMTGRLHKNGFSIEMAHALIRAFGSVNAHPAWKVVILTGYGNYFCSGGTEQMLLRLAQGDVAFSEQPLYELPLLCEIPVIAAMQGHAIGAGLAFGLFSDIVVLSRESMYLANFMRYGFTPGFGATLVLREKLGAALAQEMMLTAGTYHGDKLAKRGVPFPVLPRAHVLAHACELAAQLALKPKPALVALKAHMSADLRARLPTVIAEEVAMHRQTLGHPEVLERIRTHFGGQLSISDSVFPPSP